MFRGANPNAKDNKSRKPIQYTNNFVDKEIMKKVRAILNEKGTLLRRKTNINNVKKTPLYAIIYSIFLIAYTVAAFLFLYPSL